MASVHRAEAQSALRVRSRGAQLRVAPVQERQGFLRLLREQRIGLVRHDLHTTKRVVRGLVAVRLHRMPDRI